MKSQFLPLAYWGSYRGSSIREDALNVIVTIEGKEAIPVRAIPLLTDWEILSPDVCARIFSGDDTLQYFKGMSAHRLNPDGGHQVMEQREWANWIARKLRACSERIKAAQASHESGHQQWRQESLALLPAGAFVWREAFEAAHKREYGPNSKRARFNRDTFNPTACELNYDPQHGPCENWRELVMEGFERLIPAQRQAEPDTIGIAQLAQRLDMRPQQVIELAKKGSLGLYFMLSNGSIADLPNPSPGQQLHMRAYSGHLRANEATLQELYLHGKAEDVREAYTRDGKRVQALPPPTRESCLRGVPLTHPLVIEVADLYALTAEVDALEGVRGASAPSGWALPPSRATVPVQPKGAPLPLTTGDIAFCFNGIRWDEKQWRKPLGDKPNWLKSCVAIPGQRGVSETRWNPVKIAAELVNNGHTQARIVRARFQKQPLLLPWLDAWKTFEADYLDGD